MKVLLLKNITICKHKHRVKDMKIYDLMDLSLVLSEVINFKFILPRIGLKLASSLLSLSVSIRCLDLKVCLVSI